VFNVENIVRVVGGLGCVGKIALFDKALASALARGALAMCAMRVGFSSFL